MALHISGRVLTATYSNDPTAPWYDIFAIMRFSSSDFEHIEIDSTNFGVIGVETDRCMFLGEE
jgi:hypothetical protein